MQQATTDNPTVEKASSTHKNLKERREQLNSSDRTSHKIAADILRTLQILSDQHNPELVQEAQEIAGKELNEAIQ